MDETSRQEKTWPVWAGYVVAIVAPLAIVVARWVLRSALGPADSFLPFILPILGAAAFGSIWPGVVATVVSAFLETYFFIEPLHTLNIQDPSQAARLIIFIIIGAIISYVCSAFGKQQIRSQKEQKLLEDEIARRRKSEKLLQLVTDHAPVLIVNADTQHRYRFANRFYAQWVNRSVDDIIGKSIAEIAGEENYSKAKPYIDRVLQGQKVLYELDVFKPGETTPRALLRCAYEPELDDKGNVVGYIGAAIDISERSSMEEELRRSGSRLQIALNAARMVAWEWELATGQVRLVGRSSIYPGQNAGDSEQAPTAEQAWKMIHPDDAPGLKQVIDYAIANSAPFTHEFRYASRTHNGKYIWIEIHASVISDSNGRPTLVGGVALDVTARRAAAEESERAALERTRAEEALQLSRQRLDLVVNSTELGLWYCDLPFSKLVWNEKCKEHFGLRPDAEVTIDTFFVQIHPDDRAMTQSAIESSIKNGTTYDVIYRTCEVGGKLRWIRAIGRAFYDEQGVARRFDGVTVDVTRQQLAEQALKDADRLKDEFLATLAHELRNPLAPIRTSVNILQTSGDADPELGMAREIIVRQVQQMSRLLDDLLDVSRITRDRLELRRELVSLDAIVRFAVETARPLIDSSRHTLKVTIPETPIVIDGDPTRLAQALSNLLNNAAKYTDSGGELRLCATLDTDEVAISVQDNGIGIPPDKLATVFDMFIQVDPSLERTQGGLGIGLTLVKRLVEMHGGRVEARSAGRGTGSEFLIYLPIIKDITVPSETRRLQLSCDGDGSPFRRRVLVADDNRDAARSLSMLLKLMGSEVRTAHDGIEAVEVAADFRPDVALLDIGMPRMNGYDAARAIRKQPGGSEMLLVALTGWGQEEDKRQSAEAGFDHHLVKPLEPSALEEILARINN